MFDNFDFRQQVHTMTGEHQNVDVHWCTHMAVENRVSGNHLSDTKPDADDLLQMENGLCLPSPYDHHLQRENYITLTTRAIVEISSSAFLKPVVCQHIQHQYTKRPGQSLKWYGTLWLMIKKISRKRIIIEINYLINFLLCLS